MLRKMSLGMDEATVGYAWTGYCTQMHVALWFLVHELECEERTEEA